jgi:hypothetical protein
MEPANCFLNEYCDLKRYRVPGTGAICFDSVFFNVKITLDMFQIHAVHLEKTSAAFKNIFWQSSLLSWPHNGRERARSTEALQQVRGGNIYLFNDKRTDTYLSAFYFACKITLNSLPEPVCQVN